MTVGDVYDRAHGLPVTMRVGRPDTEFALPYQIATSMLTTKVRILKQEFTRTRYFPIEAVSSRIKTHASIVAKAQRVCCSLLHNEVAGLWAASGSAGVQLNSPPPTAIDRWRPHAGQIL